MSKQIYVVEVPINTTLYFQIEATSEEDALECVSNIRDNQFYIKMQEVRMKEHLGGMECASARLKTEDDD